MPIRNSSLEGFITLVRAVPQDSAQAFDWIMKAAKQGDTDAEFFISTCYGEGWGVAKDNGQEMAWLRKGAEQGHFNSQFMLGRAYAAGMDGVCRVWTTRKPISGWTLLVGEVARRERKEALKRRDKAATQLTPADLSRVQERARKWSEDHAAKPLAQ